MSTSGNLELDEVIRAFDEHSRGCGPCSTQGSPCCEDGSRLMQAMMDILSRPDCFVNPRKRGSAA